MTTMSRGERRALGMPPGATYDELDTPRARPRAVLTYWIWPRCYCTQPAVGQMFQPDGKPSPGGTLCWQHGAQTWVEFQLKLGEIWPIYPLARVQNHVQCRR